MQGDFAKLQGQRRLIPPEGPRISMGWIGLSLIQGAGRPSFHSREGRFRNTAPVLFGDIHAASFNVRFRALFGHQGVARLCRRMTQTRHSASMAFTQPSVVATAFLNLTASAPVHKEARRPAKGLLHQWRSPRGQQAWIRLAEAYPKDV